MKHYIADKWRDILVFNDLDTAEKIWALEAEWFEEPNHRRGGWSGVSRIELKLPLGGTVGVFLKRQEDHVSRSILHLIKGVPTFVREFDVIQRFEEVGIPTLSVMFFEHWKANGHQRAVIMTEELQGFTPLPTEGNTEKLKEWLKPERKQVLFERLAELMHAMHDEKFQHGCFYPKHVFIKHLPTGDVDLRVIDLEKVKKRVFKKQAVFRDLDTLLRHSTSWSEEDKLTFFKIHQGENVLSRRSKKLWRRLNKVSK